MEAQMSNATKIRQKEQKETTKEGGLSSTDTILPVVSLFSLRSNNLTTRTSQ